MSIESTNSNLAKETGGNLATLVALTRSIEQAEQTQRLLLAAIRALGHQMAAISGVDYNPDAFLDDIN